MYLYLEAVEPFAFGSNRPHSDTRCFFGNGVIGIGGYWRRLQCQPSSAKTKDRRG